MHNPELIKNIEAAGTIAARHFVSLNSSGLAVQAQGGPQVIGVAELAAASGDHADIIVSGIAEVMAASSISPGNWISTDENGCAQNAPSGGSVCGVALDAASAGEYVSVRLAPAPGVFIPRHHEEFFEAGGDVSAAHIVKFDASGKIGQTSANTDIMLGVAMGDADSENGTGVAFSGIVEVVAGGSVSAGAAVSTDASGAAVTATSTKRQIGYALTDGTNGEKMLIVISPGVAA